MLGTRRLQIPGQHVEEQPMISRALHVALATQRVDAAAGAPDVA